MIFYSSDMHFNHYNIITACKRPFKTVEEMNELLIKNWNNKVSEKDIVYYLGDFAIIKNLSDVDETVKLVKRLNGKKVLIVGNHDSRLIKNNDFIELFDDITIYKKISDNNRFVVLMHYPLESWERSYYGSYHIHGHTHNYKLNDISNRFNAGVDVNDFMPVTLDELVMQNNINK